MSVFVKSMPGRRLAAALSAIGLSLACARPAAAQAASPATPVQAANPVQTAPTPDPAGPDSAPHVTDTSFTAAGGGERVLQESIVTDAPPACPWKAFTDEAAMRAWNFPFASVDLRSGGTIAQSWDANAKPGGPQVTVQAVVTWLPERLLVLRSISAPPGTPGVEAWGAIVQVLSLTPLTDTQTLVTLSDTGYRTGVDFDRLYEWRRQNNAALLVSLKALCERGAGAAPSPSP